MNPLAVVQNRLRDLIRSERGMALPVALFAMIAGVALASAAVIATVNVQEGSHRDSSTKSAIAAADAGANVARLRLARYATVLGAGSKCLSVGSGGTLQGTTPAADGWCPEVKGTVGGATYSYRTTPAGTACGTNSMCVVATGTTNGVTRRIEVTYNTTTPPKNESGETETEVAGSTWSTGVGIDGVIGVEHVEIDNNADARVNVGTNGDVTVLNNGNICGNIRHGIGKKATFQTNGTQCKGYKITEANVTVPSVSSFMPTNIATVNGDSRLAKCTSTKPTKAPTNCESEPYTGNYSTTVPWNATTRTISTSNNKTLTLGSPGSATDYFVCKLELSNNSHLIIPATATVRVFFDTPENCKLPAGTKQIDISNNADITSTGYQPSLGKFELPGFYLMGSTSISTKVEWSNNSGTNEFVLYGPNTEINLNNNATYIGIIAGKTVHLNNNAIVKQDTGFSLPTALNPWKSTGTEGSTGSKTEPTSVYYEPQAFVECSGPATPGLAPNANC